MAVMERSDVREMRQRGDLGGLVAVLQDRGELGRRREDAATALGWIGNASAVEPLAAALRDPEWEVRLSVVLALGNIGDLRAVEPLIGTLQDDESVVRAAATRVLGEFGDARAIEGLIAALEDTSSDVRWYAADYLPVFGGTDVEHALAEYRARQ